MTTIDETPETCIHGMYPATCCTICSGKDQRVSVAYVFPAEFGSRLDCGHAPEIGEQIARLTDDRLMCQGCAP